MTKVLILAYDFPPYVSVGALRPYSWYKYLNEFRVYPVVVTRQWSNSFGSHLDYVAPGEVNGVIEEKTPKAHLIKAPYKPNLANRILLTYGDSKFVLIRKLVTGFYEYVQWIFTIGPKATIFKEADHYLSLNKVDVIIASGDPFILFKYASKLSKKYNTPWIADYRDPWSQGLQITNQWFKWWNVFFEKRTLKSCSNIVTVSKFVQYQISSLLKNKRFTILPNGFDDESINEIKDLKQQNGELTIALSGTIYKWHPVNSFLSVFNEFIKENPNAKIKINFYGINNVSELSDFIDKNCDYIKNRIQITQRIPNAELLKIMAQHNVFLLFNYYSYMGTKIYDYLAMKRKILLCYSDDSEAKLLKANYYKIKEDSNHQNLQSELIIETNSGIIVKDKAHLKQVLIDLYNEFTENGFIACNSNGIEKFSRKIQTQKLAELIETIK